MKRVLGLFVSLVVLAPVLAGAQGKTVPPPPAAAPPLADVAKAEEARRKNLRQPAKVYTNTDLKSDFTTPVAPAAPPKAAPVNGSTTIPLSPEPPQGSLPGDAGGAKDEKYWRDRIASARETLNRSRMFADALQTRINSLATDIVNRDDPAQKMQLEQQRRDAMAELDRVKKQIETETKAVAAVEEDGRRASVPAAWLR